MKDGLTQSEAVEALKDPRALPFLLEHSGPELAPEDIKEAGLLNHIWSKHLRFGLSAAYDVELAATHGFSTKPLVELATAALGAAEYFALPDRGLDAETFRHVLVRSLTHMELCGAEVDWQAVEQNYPQYADVDFRLARNVPGNSWLRRYLADQNTASTA